VRRRPPRLPGRAASVPAEEQITPLPEPEPARQPDPAGKYAERTPRHHELVHRLRAEGRGLREIARHLGWGPAHLTEDEKPRLRAILDRCPELQATSAQVRAFAAMITELTGQDLPQWMAAGTDLPGISSFAKGLEQDLDAATNGLTTTWSSGPVEGRVNHIILWNQICQVLQVVGLLFASSHAGGAVDALAQEVRVAVVPGVLGDHVRHNPSQ
jgi:hypothetical protein